MATLDPPKRVDSENFQEVWVLTTDLDLHEIRGLVEAAGFRVGEVIFQARNRSDPATFLGKGKLQEVRRRLRNPSPPLVSHGTLRVVVNGDLRPSVLFNLSEELDVEVWDRIRLILEIFQKNAQVKEARLQVELARLRYELPLLREALHRRLTGQRPGFMGGGEVEIRTHETQLRRRTHRILKELERVRKERETRRKGRRRSGLGLVAIVGYTNSGKSTLLNRLTQSNVLARQQVFTTLQTTTRRSTSQTDRVQPFPFLFTDTVGFIRNLPPWLIDAFGSTLEEITESDGVLLVVDASERVEMVQEKTQTALEILERIQAPQRLIILFNKVDQILFSQREKLLDPWKTSKFSKNFPTFFTSARTGEGLEQLTTFLFGYVSEPREANIVLNVTKVSHHQFEHWLRNRVQIVDWAEKDGHRQLRIRCPRESWSLLLKEAKQAGVAIEPVFHPK